MCCPIVERVRPVVEQFQPFISYLSRDYENRRGILARNCEFPEGFWDSFKVLRFPGDLYEFLEGKVNSFQLS